MAQRLKSMFFSALELLEVWVTDVVLRQRSDHMGTKDGLRSGLKMRTVRIATCNLCTGLRELCDGASCTLQLLVQNLWSKSKIPRHPVHDV